MVDNKKMRVLTGEVVSIHCDKTVTILVSSIKTHKLYKKNFTVSRKYKAHDENNSCKIGEIVSISSSRPISKGKSYIITDRLK